MKFAIVTPCFNPGELLAKTMESVLSQTGDISVFYHVQDAGSNDGTMTLLQSQLEQLERKHVPAQCKQLTFSYAQHQGDSIYGAINRGFEHILTSTSVDGMLWVNQGDLLTVGALSTVAQYLDQAPHVNWLIGRTLQLNESGEVFVDEPPNRYRTRDIAAGRHDGTILPFVTQQAVVWRPTLWEKCGPLNEKLSYAGDFEYWVRAATANFDLERVDIHIGAHRKRLTQSPSPELYTYESTLVLSDRAT